jgi:hypothetical protein
MRRTLLALPPVACRPAGADTPWQRALIGGAPVPACMAVTPERLDPAGSPGPAPCSRYFKKMPPMRCRTSAQRESALQKRPAMRWRRRAGAPRPPVRRRGR